MNLAELLLHTCTHLDRLGIQYQITGSFSSSAFGEPRSTNDIDIVIALNEDMVPDFCEGFTDEAFYFSEDAVRQAVRDKFQFNVIHTTSGYKIDFMIMGSTEYDQLRLDRSQRLEYYPGRMLPFASPEDVIIMKLVYFREGNSDKHLRDIAGIIRVQKSLDWEYMKKWTLYLNVNDLWNDFKQKAQST